MSRKFTWPGLPVQILFGLFLGVICGFLFPHFAVSLKPLADVFLRMIRMIVVPLVFCALIVGIAGTGSFKDLGRLSLKSIIWFEVATTVALVIGLLAVNIFKPGVGVVAPHSLDTSSIVAASKKSIDILQIFIEIVPTNIVDSMARGALLQIVFFSVFFGLATAAAGKHGEPIVKLAENITNVMFRFTMFVMKLAPIGVFGAIAFSVGTYGIAMLLPLGKLLLCLYGGLVVFLILLLGFSSLIWRVNFFHLLRAIKDPLLLAFSTVLALVMGLAYSSLSAIGRLGGALDIAVNGTAKKLRLVGEMQSGFQEMRANATKAEISLLNAIIGQLDTRRLNAGATCGSCHTSDTVDTERQNFEAVATRLGANVAQFTPVGRERRREASRADGGRRNRGMAGALLGST